MTDELTPLPSEEPTPMDGQFPFKALRASIGQSMLAQYNLSMSIRHLAVAVLFSIKGNEAEVVAELEKIHQQLGEADEHLRQSIEMADIAVDHASQ